MDMKEDYKIYLQWWQACGEMANPQIEYMAWKAGRDFQIEQSAQQLRAPDAACTCAEDGDLLKTDIACPVHGAEAQRG